MDQEISYVISQVEMRYQENLLPLFGILKKLKSLQNKYCEPELDVILEDIRYVLKKCKMVERS